MKSIIRTEVKIDNLTIYVTPTGLKVGTKGRVTRDVSSLYQQLTKGEARQVRKALRAQGLNRLAAERRF